MAKIWNRLELGTFCALIAATASPAMAQVAPPTTVAEPGTLGIFTIGIGGAYLVSKYLRRK